MSLNEIENLIAKRNYLYNQLSNITKILPSINNRFTILGESYGANQFLTFEISPELTNIIVNDLIKQILELDIKLKEQGIMFKDDLKEFIRGSKL